MTLKEMLNMMNPDQEVVINFIDGCDREISCSLRDGLRTAEECLMNISYNLLGNNVSEIRTITWPDRFAEKDITSIVIDVYLDNAQ